MSSAVDTGFGFHAVPSVPQYSAGVYASPGYEIVRYRFTEEVPVSEAFDRIEELLVSQDLPTTSVCAFELRSPAPFTEEGFAAFNKTYNGRLEKWGLLEPGYNPVSRSNVCPKNNPPSETVVYAFSIVRPTESQRKTFVVAGSGEVPEGKLNYHDHIVALGDTSPEGMRTKAKWVIREMSNRLQLLGATWTDVCDANVYTVHEYLHIMDSELPIRTNSAYAWVYANPPIVGLDYEMDCRAVAVDYFLEVTK